MTNITKNLNQEGKEALQSYSETLAFMVAEVFDNGRNYAAFSKVYPENEYGLIERLNTIIEWATQFEIENENREWDGEWMDEVDSFIKGKLQ